MVISLTHVDGTQLYQAEISADPGFLTYYVSDKQVPTEDLPSSLTIDQAWSDARLRGYFLILTKQPADIHNFAEVVGKHGFGIPGHASFAWVQYQENSSKFDATYQLDLEPGKTAENVVIATGMIFQFGNYGLPFMQQGLVQPVSTEDDGIHQFRFEYPLDYPPDRPPGLPPEIPRPEGTGVNVPLLGPQRYVLQSLALVGDFSNNPSQGWDVGLRYFHEQGGRVVSQVYPIFAPPGNGYQVEFLMNWDPLAPLDPKRSWMQFTGNAYIVTITGEGQGQIERSTDNRMATFFRTVYGSKIDLIPMRGSDHPPKLVPEALPPVDGNPRYYLAPDGDFELAVQGQETVHSADAFHLLCGLSGAESFSFVSRSLAGPGDVMRFEAGKNAYAPVFPIIQESRGVSVPPPKSAALAQERFARSLEVHLKTSAREAAKPGGIKSTESLATAANLLTNTYRTSWINIRPNPARNIADAGDRRVAVPEGNPATDLLESPIYFSQPNDAALYDHGVVTVDVRPELLQLRDTPAAFFTDRVIQSVPLAPYAGVSDSVKFNYDGIRQFEIQVIAPSRREAVSNIPIGQQTAGRVFAESTVVTTTPQGLLATVPIMGLDWLTVLLAKSESKGVEHLLQFTEGITRELRDVLQSNQLFMVATKAEPLGKFKKEITIADWPFMLNVGKGSDVGNFSNIIIFKFAAGSLEERVKDPQSWNGAGVFNDNPKLVSNWISSYIENARLASLNDNRLTNFLEIVSNPAWNGILGLKADISVQAFPEDLKGLLAGIDRNDFFAHHFGIEVNFIKPDPREQLTLPKSSLFGLINYVDRSFRSRQDLAAHLNGDPFAFSVQETASPLGSPQAPQELYDFKVLLLQVVFENSDIRDFVSKIQITTTTWFDEPAQLDTDNSGDALKKQSIQFNGSYEKHNGLNTYSFVTEPGTTYKFLLQSQVMNYVEIVKAQFNTLRAPDQNPTRTKEKSEQVFSRFTFWGYMNYKQIPTFDLFSFGDDSDKRASDRQGLFFANLAVEMNFKLDDDTGAASERVFTFDPKRISFDPSQSTPRVNSLFRNFPIKLNGLIYNRDAKSKPPDLGFLPIIIQWPQSVSVQELADKWYALVYDLNLGSMGALAAKAGFLSQISTAWSPDTKVRRLTSGVKLPGVGGGQKTLSLQSVLNINIASFNFISSVIGTPEAAEAISYLLRFNNVKLSLLGKKFPGAADTQFILFGDFTGSDKTTLAWYAAYYRPPPKPPTVRTPGKVVTPAPELQGSPGRALQKPESKVPKWQMSLPYIGTWKPMALQNGQMGTMRNSLITSRRSS